MDEVDATSLAGGLALIAVGAVLLVDAVGLVDLGLGWLAPLLTGAAGVVLIASGAAARARSAPARPAGPARPQGGAGGAPGRTPGGDALGRAWDRLTDATQWAGRHRPAGAAELRDRYRIGLGTLELDLSAVQPPPGRTEVHARVGIGTLVVTVPANARVVVRAHAGLGSVEILDESRSGVATTLVRELGEAGGAELVVHAGVDLGTVAVRRPA